jgi:hypothetical protein
MALLHSSLAFAALGILAPAADEQPTPEQVRGAVKRSMVFIEKEGVAWMKGRQCSSCHQVPMLVWTSNAANKRGFAVNPEKLDVWNAWIVNDALKRNTFHKLTDASVPQLQQGGISPANLAKLQPIKNSNFVLDYEFDEELAKHLTPEVAAQHKELLHKSAAVPNQGTQGGSNSSSGYTTMILAAGPYSRTSEESRKGLIDGLVKSQPQDGIWKPAGQFLAQQWPAAEAQQVHTMWAVLALGTLGELPEPAVQARSRALAALCRKNSSNGSTPTAAGAGSRSGPRAIPTPPAKSSTPWAPWAARATIPKSAKRGSTCSAPSARTASGSSTARRSALRSRRATMTATRSTRTGPPAGRSSACWKRCRSEPVSPHAKTPPGGKPSGRR